MAKISPCKLGAIAPVWDTLSSSSITQSILTETQENLPDGITQSLDGKYFMQAIMKDDTQLWAEITNDPEKQLNSCLTVRWEDGEEWDDYSWNDLVNEDTIVTYRQVKITEYLTRLKSREKLKSKEGKI